MDYQSKKQIEFMSGQLELLNLTDNPRLSDIVVGFAQCFKSYYLTPLMWEDYSFLEHGLYDIRRLFFFTVSDLVTVLISAVLFTFFRMWFERRLCERFMNRVGITDPRVRPKFRESMFKTFYYSCTWIYCAACLHSSGLIGRPTSLWDGWQVGVKVPQSIRMILMAECGFYVHSLYATVFMDSKRKDYYVMLIHHCVSSALIALAYAFRYHMTGLLVLFLHDINDVFLEGTKVLKYMHKRNGKVYPIYELLSSIGFFTFTVSWLITRTYLFLFNVLYGTLVVSCKTLYMKKAGNYMLMNVLLLTVFALDLYWLYNIVSMLYKILSGQMKDLRDIREEGTEQTIKSAGSKPQELTRQNGFISNFVVDTLRKKLQ